MMMMVMIMMMIMMKVMGCGVVPAGGVFIPVYTGRVIDSLRTGYQEREFLSAIVFISVFSLGR